MRRIFFAIALAGLSVGAAHAQTNADKLSQRDLNQQQRIEQGLKSGQLSTKEASQLERDETRVDRTQARDLKDGSLSPAERAQIQRQQNAASAAIYRDKHNAVTGNPDSKSSERMQADVQRNVNQDTRIRNGVASGQVTNRELGHLDRGQAHIDHAEARAGRNGFVNAREQRNIQGRENRQSRNIYRKKHNGRVR